MSRLSLLEEVVPIEVQALYLIHCHLIPSKYLHFFWTEARVDFRHYSIIIRCSLDVGNEVSPHTLVFVSQPHACCL